MDSGKNGHCSTVSQDDKKTILFVCLNAISHVNSVLSMANHLKNLGHRTVFLFNKPFASKLDRLGHEVYDCTTPDLTKSPCDESVPNETSELLVNMNRDYWSRGNHIETLEFLMVKALPIVAAEVREFDSNVESKMKLLQPDCFVIDHFFGSPALFKLNIPWARVWSASPLFLHANDLPQAWLGLPTEWNKDDPKYSEWHERALKVRRKVYDDIVNPFWKSHGLPDLPTNPLDYLPVSPYLNIYMFPEELDYAQPLTKWERCDCLIRDHTIHKYEVPEKLRNKPGKLIFLSMGSMASADARLMKRLTSMLSDCPHRFIVVTGPHHDQYELPENMIGGEFLPQLEILPVIDLIITHGGNNTITESFYFGVPGMIVCPLFGDQPDNAQRLQEKGIGVRLDPYNCSKEELHGAIEEMLNREGLKDRMKAISMRMQAPGSRNKPLKLISDFVDKHLRS